MSALNRSGAARTNWFLRYTSHQEFVSRIAFFLIVVSIVILGAVCFYNAAQWVNKPFAGFLFNRRMIVPSMGTPGWTGFKGGIKPFDKIIQADQKSVSTSVELEKVILAKRAGEQITYTVIRGGQELSITVPSMRMSVADLALTFGSFLLQGFIFLCLGAAVFVLKPDTAVSWVFFGAASLQSISSLINFDVASQETPFSYLMIMTYMLNPALDTHFSTLFPRRIEFVDQRSWIRWIPYTLSTIFILILTLLYPDPLFYKCFGAINLPNTATGIFFFLSVLVYSYLSSKSTLARQRARVMFWGALAAFPLPLIAWGVSYIFKSEAINVFTNFTSIPLLIFPAVIAYSITRHNLFDVDVYIKRAVGYGIMTAVVGSTYFALQITLKSVVFESILGNKADYVYPVIFALLVVFLFNPLNRMVQDVVDRLFFRKKFDYKEAVLSISNALSSVLNLEEVVHQINHAVRKEMFIDVSGVIVLDSNEKKHLGFFVNEDDTSATERGKPVTVSVSDPLVEMVCRERKMITKYDVAEDPRYAGEREVCASRFDELDASLAIPLLYQDRVNAVITVGHKKSGHYFTKEDIELLTTLASHGAVSIENARMAEQMQKEEIVRTNLSRYLSPQIVEGIVKSDMQVNLGGDRKVVTVLFSDIRDFTSITENRPPDQLIRHLNEYFTGMAEVIFANQGSLDKYIGDAIVAVFGSLIPLENPEMNAVKASIEMMKKLEELNRMWIERGDFPMYMGIGVNTGEVFLGNIGSQERMEFTVIGDTVNVASRFSGLAKGGQILVTKSARAGLDDSVRINELPPSPVKGKAELQEVYEVVYCN